MKTLIIAILAISLYVAISELSAKRKAESLCNSFSIGDKADNLLEIAINARARKSGIYLKKMVHPRPSTPHSRGITQDPTLFAELKPRTA